MKVILLQDVKGTGKKEQMLEVSDGFARNYLLPRKLAVEASANAVNSIKNAKAAEEYREMQRRKETIERAALLKDKEVTVKAKAGGNGRLFGSVTGAEIAAALLEQQHITLDKRKIELAEPIRQTGRVEITLRMGPNIATRMYVNVVAE